MITRRPPKLATLLLCFAPGHDNQALLGDLLEEFRNGRSRSWFWRQTLFILALRFGREASVSLFGLAFLAVPDLIFGLLKRPPRNPGIWEHVSWIIEILAFGWLFARPKRPEVRWEGNCFFAACFAFVCLQAWVSTDSLASRLWRDAEIWATFLILFPIFRERRVKVKKPD